MMPLYRVGSVKSRITALVILLVFAASVSVAIVSLLLVERQMQQVVGDQQYALLSSTAALIDEDLQSKKTLLKVLTEQIPEASLASPAALQQYLETHATLRDEFFNVVAADANGTMVANLMTRAFERIEVRDRQYFKDTVAFKEGVVSQPFWSALSKRAVVVVTEPVFDRSGKLLYVIIGSIDLRSPRFFGQFESLKPGRTGYLFMITSDGTIIHHPDEDRMLKRVHEEPGGAVPSTDAALKGFEGWTVAESKRSVESLITYRRLRAANWIIGAVYPIEEAFTPLIKMRRSALLASLIVAVLSGMIGFVAVLRLLRPLRTLQQHVANMGDGHSDSSVFDVKGTDEFGELSRAFHLISRKREASEASLALLASTDNLTGLCNRRIFEELFADAARRSRRTNTAVALAFLDVDHFKQINDTYGHAGGDEVLIEFARRLRMSVRSTDTVARLGGDEFVVLFEDLSDATEPTALAEKIMASMHPAFSCAGRSVRVTTSVGVAVARCEHACLADFLSASDKALYDAKQGGRNRYVIHELADSECLPRRAIDSRSQSDANEALMLPPV